MEKASRRPWAETERSPRAMQLREYTLKEFREIFVNDRPLEQMRYSDMLMSNPKQ